MQIQGSSIVAKGTHEQTNVYVRQERLLMWRGERPDVGAPAGPALPAGDPAATVTRGLSPGVVVNVSDEALRRADQVAPKRCSCELDDELDVTEDFKARLLAKVLEALTGQRIDVVSPGEVIREAEQARTEAAERAATVSQPAEGRPERAGWGLEYDFYEARSESERTTFEACGVVKTADGKEITVKVALSMSREFMEEKRISVRAGDARKVDPLVINFDGNAAQLTQTKFEFDLDADGRTEQVSFVKAGSGFLALDKNGNGTVDDGSELFGPTTGNGFTELAAYDQDGNQWIDEADDVYDRLRIWTKDDAGKDTLVGLGQRGIGAIWLGSVKTPFSLKAGSELLGEVASTGLYLTESGQAGTVQQVDLVA